MEKILFARMTKVSQATGEFWAEVSETAEVRGKEVFDYEASKPLIKAWSDDIFEHSGGKSRGNLRAMHNPKLSAGIIPELIFDDEAKTVRVHGQVIDQGELEKLVSGCYTGVSFGGDYAKKWSDGGNIRYAAQPVELSLADLPMGINNRFTLVKATGEEVQQEFHKAADDKAAGDYGSKTDAGYADSGLQKDKKPRYPLKINGELNEKRIRAAWNYISKPKNADQYAAGDLKKVKDAIIAAWKEAIDKAGPPAAAEKTAAAGDLQKAMWQIGSLADMLTSLNYLASDLDWEAAYEMDDSPIPAQFKDWLEKGAEILKALVAEEVDELLENLRSTKTVVMQLAAGAGDLAKVGAAISAKNQEHVQQIHDHAAAMGATCGGGKMSKVAEAGTLAKVAALEEQIQAKDEELAKVAGEKDTALAQVAEKDKELAKVAGEKETLEKEMEELKSQPAPAKGITRAIAKEEDGELEKSAKPPEPRTPMEAVQQAHRSPFLINR